MSDQATAKKKAPAKATKTTAAPTATGADTARKAAPAKAKKTSTSKAPTTAQRLSAMDKRIGGIGDEVAAMAETVNGIPGALEDHAKSVSGQIHAGVTEAVTEGLRPVAEAVETVAETERRVAHLERGQDEIADEMDWLANRVRPGHDRGTVGAIVLAPVDAARTPVTPAQVGGTVAGSAGALALGSRFENGFLSGPLGMVTGGVTGYVVTRVGGWAIGKGITRAGQFLADRKARREAAQQVEAPAEAPAQS